MSDIRIGVIGDFNPANRTHLATNRALADAAEQLQIKTAVEWLPTPHVEKAGVDSLRSFSALFCSPGSPYASMEGALTAIRFARENNIPFFGT